MFSYSLVIFYFIFRQINISQLSRNIYIYLSKHHILFDTLFEIRHTFNSKIILRQFISMCKINFLLFSRYKSTKLLNQPKNPSRPQYQILLCISNNKCSDPLVFSRVCEGAGSHVICMMAADWYMACK